MEIGDKVKIREDLEVGDSWLEVGDSWNEWGFTENMRQFKGEEAEILDKWEENVYKLDIDEGLYGWTKETLEPVEERTIGELVAEIFNEEEIVYEPQTKKEEDIMENRELLEGNFRIEKLDNGYVVMVEADGVIKEIAEEHDYVSAVCDGLDDIIFEIKKRNKNVKLIEQKEAELEELRSA